MIRLYLYGMNVNTRFADFYLPSNIGLTHYLPIILSCRPIMYLSVRLFYETAASFRLSKLRVSAIISDVLACASWNS